jgi:phosphoglucosamine mutase
MQVPAIADFDQAASRTQVDGQGRLLIRYSGTEPLLRIMIEGKHDGEIAVGGGDRRGCPGATSA